jgi:predicted nucleotidyltransferase
MLQQQEKQVLIDLKKVIDSLKMPMLIVGGGARLLLIDIRYNIPGRTTKDWDIAVKIDSWFDYKNLSDSLTKGQYYCFKTTHTPHKFIHIATGIEVDIIPFGKIGEPDDSIEWPDGNQMNLLGLEEALENAMIEIIQDLKIRIVNYPAFLVLKLIAWSDRQADKDINDINFIMENYNKYGHYDERIWDELTYEISEGKVKFEDASIVLLTRDIRLIFREETITRLDEILSQILKQRDRVIPKLIKPEDEWDEKFDTIVRRFELLQQGIQKPIR